MGHTKTLKMPELSVIIPTHNRADILEHCLSYLEKQTIADEIEVIVINDVEDDKFTALSAKTDWQIPIRFTTIPPCHQGVARNAGMEMAQASTLLFIGDDILLAPDACERHISAHTHASTPIAVLGSVEWDPKIKITKVMIWLMQSGWQSGYPKIKAYAGTFVPDTIQHQFSYTANMSLPTKVAKRTPFREDITLYGWEDIEWGMRLRDAGVRLYFEPHAIGFHHHVITLEDSLRRMETIGKSAVLLRREVPTFDRVPQGWKLMAYQIFSHFPTMAGKHRKAFLRGINNA